MIESHINTAIIEKNNNKKNALLACIDLQKAFDTVNHDALLTKMSRLGITGNSLNWIYDFLKERTYQMTIGEENFEKVTKSTGVPQRSPLSPTLFNIMVTDLNLPENIHKIIYADDITLITNKDILEANNNMERALNILKTWTTTWDLKMNLTKS